MSPTVAAETSAPTVQLPVSVVSRYDVARIIREMENIENVFASASLRAQGQAVALPTLSQSLTDMVALNRYDLSQASHRKALLETLHQIKDKSPIMHISFAVEATPEFLQEIATWVRAELHPYALLKIGLQPSLVAGCVVRTPSHIYDFGLARHLHDSKGKLMEAIRAVTA